MVDIVQLAYAPTRVASERVPLGPARRVILRKLLELAMLRGFPASLEGFAMVVGAAEDVAKLTGERLNERGEIATLLPIEETVRLAKLCPDACCFCRERIDILTSPPTPRGRARVISLVGRSLAVHFVAISALRLVVDGSAELVGMSP